MITKNKHFRLATKIADESFNPQQLGEYNLYLTIGRDSLRAGVLHVGRNKLVVLEDYELINMYTPLQAAQQVQQILQEHAFLGKPQWQQIRVAIKNQSFTLVPETLYEPKAGPDYLQLNCDLDTYHEKVLTYRHNGIEAVNIFAADKYLLHTLEDTYPGKPIQYVHQTSAFIATLLHHGGRTGQQKVYAYVEKNSLTILIIQDGTLQFCNIFHFNTPEDFMYFLVFVLQEQKLNPETDPVTVWGDITHDSNLFTLLRKYIRHVHFGARPQGVEFSYKMEEHFEHRFLDIFSVHFCE